MFYICYICFIYMLYICFICFIYGLNYYKYVSSYSAGIDFSRENLTSTDVRFSQLSQISTHCKGKKVNHVIAVYCVYCWAFKKICARINLEE